MLLVPSMPSIKSGKLYDLITNAGLSTNLQLSLDAGDSASYSGSGNWIDRAPGANSFAFDAAAAAPTFNGTAGNRSRNEYMSFDGGDHFTLASGTNPAWIETVHKAAATWSFAAWIYFASTGASTRIVGNAGATTGMRLLTSVSDALSVQIVNAGVAALSQGSSATLTSGAWNFVALSLNEATGPNGLKMQVNAAAESYTSTYSSPAAGSASFATQIGAGGNNASPVANTTRIAMLAMWNTAIGAIALNTVYGMTRGRFGI